MSREKLYRWQLLIYDEIITGFDGTETLFFAEQVGAWPDLLCCGKGMSGVRSKFD